MAKSSVIKKPIKSTKAGNNVDEVQEIKRKGNKCKWLCQCNCGCIFDYNDRIRVDKNYFSPSQGRCPECGSMNYWFMKNSGANIYRVRWNYVI